jgi:hypothetical protein
VAKIGYYFAIKNKVPINMVKGTFWKISKKMATFGGNVFFENLQDFCLEDFGRISSFSLLKLPIFS